MKRQSLFSKKTLLTIGLLTTNLMIAHGHEHKPEIHSKELSDKILQEGEYVTPRNNAMAPSESFTNVEIPLQYTDWKKEVSFPRFLAPGRVLNQVVLKTTGIMEGRIQYWLKSFSRRPYEMEIATQFQSFFVGNPTPVADFNLKMQYTGNATPITGVATSMSWGWINQNVAPSFDTGLVHLTDSKTQSWSLADGNSLEGQIDALSTFISRQGVSKVIQMDVSAQARSRYYGSASCMILFMTLAGGSIEVEYDSSPAQCAYKPEHLKEYYFESKGSSLNVLPLVRIGSRQLQANEIKQLLSASPINSSKNVNGKNNPVLKLAQLYVAAQISIAKGSAYLAINPTLKQALNFLTDANLSTATLANNALDKNSRKTLEVLTQNLKRYIDNDSVFNDGIRCERNELENEEDEDSTDHEVLNNHSHLKRSERRD